MNKALTRAIIDLLRSVGKVFDALGDQLEVEFKEDQAKQERVRVRRRG